MVQKVHKMYKAEAKIVSGTRWAFYGEVRCDSPNFSVMEITEDDKDVTCKRCLKIMRSKNE